MSNLVNKIKICIVVPNYYMQIRGGAEYQAYLLAEYFYKNNFDVHYIHIDNETRINKSPPYKLHSIIRPKWCKQLGKSFSFIFDIFIIYKILKQLKPDLIYQRVASTHTSVAAYYARRWRKKSVWHISSELDVKKNNFQILKPIKSITQLIQKYGIKNVNIIIGQSSYQGTLLFENYKRKCTSIIPNFHPIPSEIISKSNKPIKIVWCANMKKNKRPDLFLDLAEKFSDHKDKIFLIVGRINDRVLFKNTVKRIMTLPNVKYLGELKQGEVNELLNTSHILINTSEYEGFPNTFIQAWMRGVPIISLNVNPDNVLKNEGIGFHSCSFKQLVIDLEILANNNELRKKMGEKARRYAIRNHSLSNIEKILDIFTN